MTPNLEQAMAALRSGNRLEAERIAKQGLQAALDAHPKGSLAVAQARFDFATILIAMNDYARGIEQMRQTVLLDEQTDAARRERLTFVMNLGEILQRAGQLEEAEKVHQDGLKGREAYYGADHPGYAFGLEPLAEVLLGQRRYADAKPLLTRSVEIFEAHQHPRLPAAIILEAAAAKATAPSEAALGRLSGAPTELFRAVIEGAIDKANLAMQGHYDPAVWLAVLSELRQVMVDGGWSDATALTHVVAASSNLARAAGDHDERANAFRWLIAHLDSQGDHAKAVDARLGLAMALGELNQLDQAVAVYQEAVESAAKAGKIAHSGALRNFGLFLAEIERRDEAKPLLEQAVAVARGAWGGGGEMLGRALVALGIFVQHGGAEDPSALERARALLQEGIQSLQPDHPDALPARSHLNAIENGGGCGCGNMDAAISAALQDMVLPQLPHGLLDTLAYKDGNLDVKLAREPSPEEMETLNSVLHQAMAQLKQKLRDQGY